MGKLGSLAVIERFLLTLKSAAMRVITVPCSLAAMRTESGRRLTSGKQLALKVSYLEGRKHPPIVELKAAA